MNKQIFIDQKQISFYLKDVRKLKVMTAKREKEIAKQMINGKLTELEIKIIHKEMMEGNLRFVISVAKDYQGQGLDLADLIAEGNYGLIKALGNFDWTRGFRFISYGVWWIRQSILQSLNENARTIRLPVNIIQEIQKQKKRLSDEITKLDDKLALLPKTINFDNPINDEGDTLLNILENENADNPEDIFKNEFNLKTELQKLMSVLEEREIKIVSDYYGLLDYPKTLQDIGDDFGLTKERVRQIKEKALRKLRNHSYQLLDYLRD